MINPRTLIFVGAHPDDESFGLGATLAQYAQAGTRVYYACATRGEVGSADPEHMHGYATPGDMRSAELACAARELGLADVIHLGYRDSGMPGSPDNAAPNALASAPLDEVTGRVVKVLRGLKPEVVITFDPIGGYRHPDHIAVHNATVRAFQAAGDPRQFPDAGPAFQPQKLYFHVFQKGFLKFAVGFLPLIGRDPRKFGRNQDIDLASLAEVEFPIHADVRLTEAAMKARERASACHQSQLGGGPPRSGLMGLLQRVFGRRDTYMRAHPPANGARREKDLFEGVH